MSSRPRSIAVVGWLFVAVGSAGLAWSLLPHSGDDSVWNLGELGEHGRLDLAYATASRLACILGGAFLLAGHRWARWLLVAWMAFHIVLSGLHSVSQTLVHCALFAPILFLLFRPSASAFLAGHGEPGGTSLGSRRTD